MSEPRIFEALTERRIDESVRMSLRGASERATFSIIPLLENVERASRRAASFATGELNVAIGSLVRL
jgi:hypothetical protein